MSIIPYLDEFDADPETERLLAVALEMTRVSLRLTDDLADGIIAKQIVELAKTGERNPDLLCEGALKKLREHLYSERKKRGRPATGTDPLVGTRMPRDLIWDIDRWARQNTIGSRSEAIRRLVELGLANAQRATARSNKIAKASEMAGQEIDRLSDPLATDEERQIRKRRLIKGPKEFLDIRSNRAKIKG